MGERGKGEMVQETASGFLKFFGGKKSIEKSLLKNKTNMYLDVHIDIHRYTMYIIYTHVKIKHTIHAPTL